MEPINEICENIGPSKLKAREGKISEFEGDIAKLIKEPHFIDGGSFGQVFKKSDQLGYIRSPILL